MRGEDKAPYKKQMTEADYRRLIFLYSHHGWRGEGRQWLQEWKDVKYKEWVRGPYLDAGL